jgi:hypothetical protein
MNDLVVKMGRDIERVPENCYLHRIRFFFTDRHTTGALERTGLVCGNDIAVLRMRRYFCFEKPLPVKRPYTIGGYRFCAAIPKPRHTDTAEEFIAKTYLIQRFPYASLLKHQCKIKIRSY